MAGHGAGMAERLARAGVTEREGEVLSAVAERLRNPEIAAQLHVSVRTVESHIAALLRKLAVPDRAALVELGVELRRNDRPDGLPTPLTNLVGRENELSQLAALLDASRLVTLVGPAGVGKTRLALRLANVHTEPFPDGTRFADLAPVDASLVPETLAQAVGVVTQPGWSLREVLREVAADLRFLLVLDNCEHVVEEVAGLVADVLSIGGQLRVLATSREPLGVPGEVSYQVRALSVPPENGTDVETYDAVRLFVDRAAAASPGFALTDVTAPAIASLCRRLDGLPLAIELAASRVRMFSPLELVEHVDQRFELLSAGARTAPPRHRTLRGAIDWSYQLLDDEERALFDRLAVFPADFDYDAARAVGGEAVLTVLPRLVDKSLVSSTGHGFRRYRMLETIRAFAAERLDASEAELGSGARQRHAAHYLALAEVACQRMRTADQRTWLDRLAAEQSNVRAGLAHTMASKDVDAAWRWIAALELYWDVAGLRREAEGWIDRALALASPPATPTVVAGLAAAASILRPVNGPASTDLARQATRLAAGLDDFSRALASQAFGLSAIWAEPGVVPPSLLESVALLGEDHPWETASTFQALTQAAPDLETAMRYGRQGLALFQRLGDGMFAANTLFLMAVRSLREGVVGDEVERWLTESLALAEAAGSVGDQLHAQVGFGLLAWARGDASVAAVTMAECLPALRRLGDLRCTGRALYVLGGAAHLRGELPRARALLVASVEAIGRSGQSFVLVDALEALAGVLSDQSDTAGAALVLSTARAAHGENQHLAALEVVERLGETSVSS